MPASTFGKVELCSPDAEPTTIAEAMTANVPTRTDFMNRFRIGCSSLVLAAMD
jgi:hypothetical protein